MSETDLGIDYHPYLKILGVTFWDFNEQSMNDSWAQLTGQVRTQAKMPTPGISALHIRCVTSTPFIRNNLV